MKQSRSTQKKILKRELIEDLRKTGRIRYPISSNDELIKAILSSNSKYIDLDSLKKKLAQGGATKNTPSTPSKEVVNQLLNNRINNNNILSDTNNYRRNWIFGSNYGSFPPTTTVQGNADPSQRLIENNSYIDTEFVDEVGRPAIAQDKNRIEYSPNTQRGAPTAKTPTKAPAKTSKNLGGKGVGILAAINANDAIKEAFETKSIAPIGKYALNLATGGVSGEIERAWDEGAFEPAKNATPIGATWAVTKALVNPKNYWDLAVEIAKTTGENALDIYNNFADYAWRDTHQKPVENVDKPVENTAQPYNYRTWENSSLPQGSPAQVPAVDPTSQASLFDSSPENYYKLVNSGKLGNGKDRLKNWIALGGDEASYQAGQEYLKDMYAKSYAKNKVNEKLNTSVVAPTPVVAPRPTPQEVRARKAQQDEMLRQKMLETVQNPNSSIRYNMPDYYNSSTTLQNYYLNNPDLWGRR